MLIYGRTMLVGMIVVSLMDPLGALYALYACRKKYPPPPNFCQYSLGALSALSALYAYLQKGHAGVGMIVASLKNPLGALYALYACRKKYPLLQIFANIP